MNGQVSTTDYWLNGRLYCELCGAPVEGGSDASKTGEKHRYYYCLNRRKKKCTAKGVRKDAIEGQVAKTVESFLDDTEMLDSLAVDMADRYRETQARGQNILTDLESRRRDVETKLANFVKAMAMGIINDSVAKAMASLAEQKKDLDSAIQTENVRAALFEDEASIGAFCKNFAHATMDEPQTRDLLFDYFISKIFVGTAGITIVSWFFEGGPDIDFADLAEAKKTGEMVNDHQLVTVPLPTS